MIATYQRTIFEKGDFSICAFKPENDQEPPQSAVSKYGTFVGTGFNLPHSEDIALNLDGTWESSKYGLQLKINTCISILPKTEEGIIAFLSSGVLPYIKKKMAVRIYQTFGNDVFSVLENTPQEMLKVRGITEKKLKAIQEAYTVNYGYQDLLMLLQPAGVSVSKIKKIVDKFGAAATEKVKNNPYVLFTINGFGFKTVDEIAQKTHTPPNDPLRIMGALKFVLTEAQNNGHLCMVQEELRSSAHSMLNEGFENEVVSMDEVTYVIKQMALDGTLKGDNGYAYLAYNYDNESFAAGCVRALLCNRVKTVNVNQPISDFEKSSFPLADKQKEAIEQFFRNRFSIITGGPGTGKSTVLKAILEVQHSIYPKTDVLLLAPTGKAARRMAEATGHEAFTIHSGLHIGEDTNIDSIEKVLSDVVIVDEVSMCDMRLFAMLMAAIDPQKTKLLLVGDSDQLPSVGAGNVLNELITCGKVPVTRLNLVYRQGSGSIIPVNAEKINSGDNTVIDRYIKEANCIGIEKVCILCPMKSRGKNSVKEYNERIQSMINPPAPDKPEIQMKNSVFRLGDRVMQTKNSENVSNGETGFIVEIKKDEDDNELCGIRFDGKPNVFWYYTEEMQNITLALPFIKVRAASSNLSSFQ